jgi:hypothetical protein
VIRFGDNAGIVADSVNTVKVILPERLQIHFLRNSISKLVGRITRFNVPVFISGSYIVIVSTV